MTTAPGRTDVRDWVRPGRVRGLITLLALALLVMALVASGCTLGIGENEAGGGSTFAGSLQLIPAAEREPAPDVCGVTLDDEELCLADLGGTPTVVNFWASWCGPCAREVPALVDLHASYGPAIDVVGVNEQDSLVNARSFERDQGVTYPSWFDDDAVIAGAFGGIAPSALPSTILVDSEQRVAIRLLGAVDVPQLEPFLDQLIAETS